MDHNSITLSRRDFMVTDKISIFNVFLALCNPTTREVRSLPSPNFDLPPSFREHRRQFGFRLDLMTNDYKVVWFWTFYDNIRSRKVYQPYVAVYSCYKESWRILQPENQDIFLFKYCIEALVTDYLNEAYCWLLKGEICNFSILSIDFGNDVFTEIEGPDAPRPFTHWVLKLILLDDSISLLNVTVYDRFEYDIWLYGINYSNGKECINKLWDGCMGVRTGVGS
ncbi:uncharacterized protein [Nicotiana tomentosiformis]|uniref:uncharacterized protein n=1 Tax=Nicotiana tomentosiformis TaxID=4098 RepID=UPI00388CE65C